MQEITVQELKSMMDTHEDFQLIDVREEHEFEICQIGGLLLPMGEVSDHLDKIRKDTKVVVHCRSGKRSATVIHMLEESGFKNLYNLKGGILAWAQEIDPSLSTY